MEVKVYHMPREKCPTASNGGLTGCGLPGDVYFHAMKRSSFLHTELLLNGHDSSHQACWQPYKVTAYCILSTGVIKSEAGGDGLMPCNSFFATFK